MPISFGMKPLHPLFLRAWSFLDLYFVTYGEMRPAVIGQMMLVAVIGKMMPAVIGPVTRESLLHLERNHHIVLHTLPPLSRLSLHSFLSLIHFFLLSPVLLTFFLSYH
jgi:hypothetical protein